MGVRGGGGRNFFDNFINCLDEKIKILKYFAHDCVEIK